MAEKDEEIDEISDLKLDPAIFSYFSYIKGAQLLTIGNYEHTIEEFRKILSTDPSNIEAHRMLALSLAGARRHRAAEYEARTAVSLAPDEPATYHTLGSVLLKSGKIYEARQSLKKAVEMSPQNVDFLNSLSELENVRDCPIGAEILSLRALELDPSNTWARINLAVSFHKQKRYDEALQIYLEELKDKPENPALRNNIGVLYMEKNQPDEALSHFKAALQAEPGMTGTRRNMITAIKTKCLLYGLFWNYYAFINRFSFWVKISIFTAGWLIISIFDIYTKHTGKYNEFVQPLIIFYFAVVFSIWVVPMIFNLLVDAGWVK